MPEHQDHDEHGEHGEHRHGDTVPEDYFEPAGWEQRYAGEGSIWSGRPNPQLVTEATSLPPGPPPSSSTSTSRRATRSAR